MKFIVHRAGDTTWQLRIFVKDFVEVSSLELLYNTTIKLSSENLYQFFGVSFQESFSGLAFQDNFLNSPFCQAFSGGQNKIHHFYFDINDEKHPRYESLSCVCFPTQEQWDQLNIKTFKLAHGENAYPYKLVLVLYRPIKRRAKKRKFNITIHYGIGSVFDLTKTITRFGEERITLESFKKLCFNIHMQSDESADQCDSMLDLFDLFKHVEKPYYRRNVASNMFKEFINIVPETLFQAINGPHNSSGKSFGRFSSDVQKYKWAYKESMFGEVVKRTEYTTREHGLLFAVAGRLQFPEQLEEALKTQIDSLVSVSREQRPRMFKRAKICKEFLVSGSCSKGEECEFFHVRDGDCLPTLSRAICPVFFFSGVCPDEQTCSSEHITSSHPRLFSRKTLRVCFNFYSEGRECLEGEKCSFLHVSREVLPPQLPNETSNLEICPYAFFRGNCINGDSCGLVHIREDVVERIKPQAVSNIRHALFK